MPENLKKYPEVTYYNNSDLYGYYQFTSLEDIIGYFMAVYVGDEKMIAKASRTDVAFFAQRNLAEMSFDTLKSIKSQQIEVPASLTMILPHDYVNYTKVSSVDSAGIKHVLYPTKYTSNPFHIRQDADGDYEFPTNEDIVVNSDFSTGDFFGWTNSNQLASPGSAGVPGTKFALSTPGELYNHAFIETGFTNTPVVKHRLTPAIITGSAAGSARCTWQKLNVEGIDYINFEGRGFTTAAVAGNTSGSALQDSTGTDVTSKPFFEVSTGNYYAADSGNSGGLWNTLSAIIGNEGALNAVDIPATTLRIGFSTQPGDFNTNMTDNQYYSTPTTNSKTDIFDVSLNDETQSQAFVEWTAGEVGYKEMYDVDVRHLNEVYLLVCSIAPWTQAAWGEDATTLFVDTQFDELIVTNAYHANNLQERSKKAGLSGTWESYKAHEHSKNSRDFEYEDEIYWPNQGERFGLDPFHAQHNGSFYIDELRGNIHFSSNISGKSVILDYISDGLGTEAEMKVPKLAEDAMYKSILYDIMSTRRNVGRGTLAMLKKDKFAAVRKAKLRLSNIKIEELTQILRGKSKQIKH